MESLNPYAAPTNVESESDSGSPYDRRGLTSLRTAVRFVGVATILFTVGSLFSIASGIVRYMKLVEIRESPSMAVMLMVGAVQQVFLAVGFGYLSVLVWRYSVVLSAALRQPP